MEGCGQAVLDVVRVSYLGGGMGRDLRQHMVSGEDDAVQRGAYLVRRVPWSVHEPEPSKAVTVLNIAFDLVASSFVDVLLVASPVLGTSRAGQVIILGVLLSYSTHLPLDGGERLSLGVPRVKGQEVRVDLVRPDLGVGLLEIPRQIADRQCGFWGSRNGGSAALIFFHSDGELE